MGRPLPGTEDTRSKLLAAARDLLLEEGPTHFSLREVARRVGVSPAAVYRHFEDKAALVHAACARGFQVFTSYLVRALESPTPFERLLATGEQYRRFALENAYDYRFIFMSGHLGEQHESPPKNPQDGTAFRLLVDRVRECMDAGVLANGEPEQVAVLIWAHVHGLVSLRLTGHLDAVGSDEAFAVFYRASVERLLLGLRP